MPTYPGVDGKALLRPRPVMSSIAVENDRLKSNARPATIIWSASLTQIRPVRATEAQEPARIMESPHAEQHLVR